MKLRIYLLNGLLAVAAFFGISGLAHAQNWRPACYGDDLSLYTAVKVTFTCNDPRSWYKSSVEVNGQRIAVVGAGSPFGAGECTLSDQIFGPLSSVSFTATKLAGTIAARSWEATFSSECHPSFEDSHTNEVEGYINFFVGDLKGPSLSISKSASSPYMAVGGSGQYYTISIGISNGPTTQALSIADSLPAGFTTAGAITATGGSLSGCPGPGATSLSGCSIASNTNGPVTLTVPVSIAATASSHNNVSISNTAYVWGGGSTNCTANGSCPASTSSAVINALDDTDTKAAGVASSTDVSVNDAFTSGSTFTATGGTCTGISPFTPSTNTTGVLNYTLPSGSQSCTVNYQLCAPAPYNTVCDTATLTVSAGKPSITVNKALGGSGRIASGDQFTVQILQNGNVVNDTTNSTTQGSGTSVTAGSGTTGVFGATANTAYTINETGGGANLKRYSSSVVCTRNGITQPAFNLGGSITPQGSDAYVCTITNSPKLATLTVAQAVVKPVPEYIQPPFKQTYTGDNGWTPQTVTNNDFGVLNTSPRETLAANNTATSLHTTLAESRWKANQFRCIDVSAAVSGNPSGNLVVTAAPDITIPAIYVLPGADLVCTLILGHLTP